MQQKMRGDHKIVSLSLHVKYRVIVAGWYPEHWEYVKFCAASCHEPDWHNFLTIFLATIPVNLSMINSRLSEEASSCLYCPRRDPSADRSAAW